MHFSGGYNTLSFQHLAVTRRSSHAPSMILGVKKDVTKISKLGNLFHSDVDLKTGKRYPYILNSSDLSKQASDFP